jgi:hypothetical protein
MLHQSAPPLAAGFVIFLHSPQGINVSSQGFYTPVKVKPMIVLFFSPGV